MKHLISYFTRRHVLVNVIFFGIIFIAGVTWFSIGKEEMPEFSSNWLRVTTSYPGASAQDVELFVTKPIEEELKGIVGIEELVSTSSSGVSSLRITLDDDYPNSDGVVQEIEDAVLRARLPQEVRDLPKFRQFKSAAKAIMDIGIYHKNHRYLTDEARAEIQKHILSFESQIVGLKEISSVDRSYYLQPELKIELDPAKVLSNEISFSEIIGQIQDNNIRYPLGSLKDRGESKITALLELETPKELNNLILRGNYEGKGVRLGDISQIRNGFSSNQSIFKVNGHEAIFLNVKKNVSSDILSAHRAIMDFIGKFKKENSNSPIEVVLMDDESYAVRNRLKIVGLNGVFGFIFIIIVLLCFLNVKIGFWVAMGIPFSAAFTLIIAYMKGYTINNMTLAGIIIVLGIVVDDAIIIAENISRKREEGGSSFRAVIDGTNEVIMPILASVLTTCVAFIPLFFFEGFFGKLVSYIPLVVILMLVGSLIESIFILPSHLAGKNLCLEEFDIKEENRSWFHRYEVLYEKILLKVFHYRKYVLVLFGLLLLVAVVLYQYKMKFVMFPREESKEVFVKVKADKRFLRKETAEAIAPLEEIFISDSKNVVAVRTRIGQSRRGGAVRENEASVLVEILPADDREESLGSILERWKKLSENLPGIDELNFRRGRWGHDSGNAIELQVQENNDNLRSQVVNRIKEYLKQMDSVTDVEVEEPLLKNEYIFKLKQDNLIKYNVSPGSITSTLRTFVEGSILYGINKGDEEVDVRLSVPDHAKLDLNQLMELRIQNRGNRLIPLKNLIQIETVRNPITINRTDFKRTTMIYANPVLKTKLTPIQIAEHLESHLFPQILRDFPSAIFNFKGEIEDTRESQGEFIRSIIIVAVCIYLILVVMFNSLSRPVIVLSVIPFGIAGAIFVLILHGMSVYGFFAAIGALGMLGVVVNDAIVMIDKIERTLRGHSERSYRLIAKVAATRLRPVILTTATTVVGILPTAYGWAGYDSMLAEMMLTMGWGLAVGTCITLILVPSIYSFTVKKSPDCEKSMS